MPQLPSDLSTVSRAWLLDAISERVCEQRIPEGREQIAGAHPSWPRADRDYKSELEALRAELEHRQADQEQDSQPNQLQASIGGTDAAQDHTSERDIETESEDFGGEPQEGWDADVSSEGDPSETRGSRQSSPENMDCPYPPLRPSNERDDFCTDSRTGAPAFGQPSIPNWGSSSRFQHPWREFSAYSNGNGFHSRGMPIRSPVKFGDSSNHLDSHASMDRILPLPPQSGSTVPRSVEASAQALQREPSQISISTSDSSQPTQSRKRLLSSPTTAYQNGHVAKQMRVSISPDESPHPTCNSGISTRSSSVSVPDFLREMLGPEEAKLQRREMRRLEREREQRREMEEADAAFARELQAEFDQAVAGPSASNNTTDVAGQQYQSFLNETGGLRRETWAPSNQPGLSQPTRAVATSQPHIPQTYATSPIVVQEQSQRPTGVGPHTAPRVAAPTIVNIESSDSDSDCAIQHPYMGMFPPSAATNSLVTQPGLGSSSRSSSSVYFDPFGPSSPPQYREQGLPSWIEDINRAATGMPSLLSRAANMTSSFMASLPPFHSISGPQWGYERSNYHSYDRSGLDYNDYVNPQEAAKEIRELMNNIRPDEELGLSDRTGSPEDMADGCGLYEHQKLGLAWMIQMEEGTNKGGILADDMGLGKTIQAIALIVSRRSEDRDRKTTLIVAPLALLRQWEHEIKFKIRHEKRLSVYIFHGSKKNIKFQDLKRNDIVLTTYGTLGAEYRRMENHEKERKENPNAVMPDLPLLSRESQFYRIILDEAQNIKNKGTNAFKAAAHLQALTRFCMTGTPMMNNVGELYSLISFLRIRPYCEHQRFKRDIENPLKDTSATINDTAMRRLQVLLKAILLRRTKKSEIDGRPILELPERTTIVEHAVMEGDQADFYAALETQTQIRFNRYLRNGTIGRNYHGVLLLLLRLRQTCCHPHLIRNLAEDVAGTTGKSPEELERIARDLLSPEVVKRLIEEGQIDCPICMDAVENSTIFTPCGHATCSECFTRISDPAQAMDEGIDSRNNRFKCMNCRGAVDPTKVTDWNSFKKVHMDASEVEEANDDGSEAQSNTESASENESEDESDSLDGFIVDDDEEIDASKVVKDKVKGKVKSEDDGALEESLHEVKDEDGDGDFKPPKGRSVRNKEKKRKGKGKAKSKGKEKLNIKLKNPTLSELQKQGRRNQRSRREYFNKLRDDFVSSAKIDKCLEILQGIAAKSDSEKTIVFSQFTTFLDLMEVPLTERKWLYRRYDGSMSVSARDEAVFEFTHRKRCRIMLVSLKAGNAGLNLTAANNVIMLDPFWNPYIEQQAIDRVHRIGQRLPVTCYRILIKGTVEDRIMDIQENKRRIVDGALDEGAASGIARLSQSDLEYLFVSCMLMADD